MSSRHESATIDLLIAPAACGKTDAVVRRLKALHGGRALALVPSSIQQQELRRRLGRARGVQVAQFYRLAGMVLARAGGAPELLGDMARLGLVRELLGRLRAEGRLPVYAAVAGKPGFIAAVAELLLDLGNADIAPAAFAAAARTPHDAELAEIYRRYVLFQEQHGVADLPRRLQLARAALLGHERLLDDHRLLVVDGFDQFAPVQLSLLAALPRHVPQMLLTLTCEARDRPAQRRFARTYAEVQAALHPCVVVLKPDVRRRSMPLRQLESRLFDLDDNPNRIPVAGAVTVIEAADREREVRAVLRRIQHLIDGGAVPSRIAVLFRDGAPYIGLLGEIAAEYRLPLDIHAGLPLDQAPPVATLLRLLRLPLDDYPRRALIEVLRSPYLPTIGAWRSALEDRTDLQAPGSKLQSLAARLDAVAHASGIVGGLARWRAALDRLAAAPPEEPVDEEQAPPVAPEEAAALREILDRLHAWLTPPDEAPIPTYVAWVRERVAALRDQTLGATEGPRQPFAARDEAAIARLEQVVRELDRAAGLLAAPPLAFGQFLGDLTRAIRAAHYRPPLQGGIMAMAVLSARGLIFDHVAIMGLSEGEFPQPLREPALYSRIERRALREERGLALPAPDPADEQTLFYEAVARAQHSLILSRTRLDEAGNPLPRSPYLGALLELADGVEVITVPAGAAPAWEQAASPQERALALADLLARPLRVAKPEIESRKQPDAGSAAVQPAAPPLPAELTTLSAQLAAEYPVWGHIVRARAIEAWREGLGPYGPFEGVIDDPQLAAAVAQRLGPQHQWSITEFNDYLTCPFRFAAAHVLGLQPRRDPEDMLDSARRGQLYHAILARAGERWRAAQLALTPENEMAVLEVLDRAAQEVLDTAPERFGFAPSAFWNWERAEMCRRLRAALRGFIRDDPAGSWAAFMPAGVEQRFGGRGSNPPLRIETPGGAVLIQGRVDRVDQRSDGALAVVDYKSGGARAARDALEGRDLQLPIYILAVERVLAAGQPVAQAAFFHVGSGRRSGELKGEQLRQALAVAQERIAETLAAVHRADFRVRPRDTCPDYCEFEAICRRNLEKRRLRSGE